jgi:hypothetical protein
VVLVRASLAATRSPASYQGAVGLRNYARLLEQEALGRRRGQHGGVGRRSSSA